MVYLVYRQMQQQFRGGRCGARPKLPSVKKLWCPWLAMRAGKCVGRLYACAAFFLSVLGHD